MADSYDPKAKPLSYLVSSVLENMSTQIVVTVICLLVIMFLFGNAFSTPYTSTAKSIFDITVDSITGEKAYPLSKYAGKKAYLVVNLASKWGLTSVNYKELAELHQKYSDKGLVIIGCPCNSFGGQEPGTNEEIHKFAEDKGAKFPITGKLVCEHKDKEKTHALYRYLKSAVPGGFLGSSLKWNFAKFLCDANGVPVKRYLPINSPMSIEPDIVKLLEL